MPGHGVAGPDANHELTANFALEIDGIDVTAYKKVSIDGFEWSTMSTRTGIDNLNSPTGSGLKKVHVITFEQPLNEGGGADVATIWNRMQQGSSAKFSGAVVQNNREQTEVNRMTFNNGWIKKCTPPSFDAEEEAGASIYAFEIEASELLFEVA